MRIRKPLFGRAIQLYDSWAAFDYHLAYESQIGMD